MKMILENSAAAVNWITNYAPGRVTINGQVIKNSVIVTPDRLLCDWRPGHFEDLERAHMDPIIELGPDVALIGTGERQHFPSRDIMLSLLERNIGLEVMDTHSACRTYNILTHEGRRVVAALIIG
ncbi:MAG: Mth938-like domain-containing protein [Nitrococcus sp.]|nr:Mth938-like domain-containing protein [Nitrococcus sp.]